MLYECRRPLLYYLHSEGGKGGSSNLKIAPEGVLHLVFVRTKRVIVPYHISVVC